MRRLLLLTLAAALALPASAGARGGDYGFRGGTPQQQRQVRAALDASAFDWGVVRERITIHIGPGLRTSALPGHVWLDAHLVDSGRFGWASIQDEYAHQVHFLRFDSTEHRLLTTALGARDWCYADGSLRHADYGCERFASTLVWSFWPSKHNAYRPTSARDESAAMAPGRFRALVTDLLGIDNPFAITR